MGGLIKRESKSQKSEKIESNFNDFSGFSKPQENKPKQTSTAAASFSGFNSNFNFNEFSKPENKNDDFANFQASKNDDFANFNAQPFSKPNPNQNAQFFSDSPPQKVSKKGIGFFYYKFL